MWCKSTRRDSHPGNRHRPPSRSRAARRIAEPGRRRRRPRASTAPPSPWVIQDSAAVQPSICAVVTLIAGPSWTWHRAGSAGSPGTRTPAGVSAETPGPAAGAGGPASTSVPAWTTTWYTSASSAPATFPARNDSATATRPSASSDDVRTAGSPGTAGGGVAGVPAETPAGRSPARPAQAARKAFSSTAPASGGSRNVPDSDPSSSTRQASRRRTRALASSAWVTWRWARANRSSWLAVIGPASSASPASVAGVTIRVSARTLAYDSFAAANRARITGRSRSARATRTCSRAVPEDIWHFHDSHCAQEPISHDAQPRRASKSASRTRNRHVVAARCPASSQICASTRSSGTRAGSAGDAAASAGGKTAAEIEPDV
jgi:hypothetical protein